MTNEEVNKIGAIVLDASLTVHRGLGPGLLEAAYELALLNERMDRGLKVQRQVPVQLMFRGRPLGKIYEMDLLVENEIIIEVKSVVDRHPVYTA